MEIDEFNKQNELIKNEILNLETDEKEPILDGVINSEGWLKASPKILWLLKEAYDKENDGEGGWDLAEKFDEDNIYSEFFQKKENRSKLTWYPIIYSSYCILNGIKCFDDVDWIHDKPEMVKVLKQIAFININKLAGDSTSNMSNLKGIFKENKTILEKQIKLYNPDIIIGCNTLDIYLNSLELETVSFMRSKSGTPYYLKNDKLYIDAYHPARIGISRENSVNEEFVDDIIEIYRENYMNKK